ncbi:MAG: alpha/beta hydrolase [Pyrinomonadaceae bacterium]
MNMKGEVMLKRVLVILLVFIGSLDSLLAQSRPQTPRPPFPYLTREVSYKNARDGTVIGGTLTVSKRKGRFPAVVLLPGSGAVDRDQTMLGHKPFAVIADYLARRNIAVLRVDSRGVGKSTGNYYNSTGDDFSNDVLAGIEFLKQQKEIDTEQIGLIGHSLGSIIAPFVAAKTNDVKFIVLLGAPAFSGDETFAVRFNQTLRAKNLPEAEMQKFLAVLREFQEMQKQNANDEKMRPVVRELLKAVFPFQPSEKDLDDAVAQQLAVQKTPYAKFFSAYDPRESLKKVTCPVLALNGSLDVIVSAKENLSAIYDSLSHNNDVTVMEIYGINHLFQTAKTGSPTEYEKIEESISPKVLEIIADWIGDHSSKPRHK